MNRKRAEELCEAYFRSCDEKGRYYTQAGLMVALGADRAAWEKWRRQKSLRGVLELALARIQDNLEQRDDKMALSLIGKPPYGGEDKVGEGPIRVVFGDGGDVREYGG